jgi:endonuclease/exonuclease/phosphatase family metal-dependent hydrolase
MRFVWVLALAGCGDREITFVTSNVGLAVGFVPAAEERAPLAAQAVADLGADVVCVQEVWLPDQVDAFQSATAATLPESAFLDPSPQVDPGPACAAADLSPLVECVQANCGGCSDALADCVLDHCGLEYLRLPDTCDGCVQANIGGDIAEVEATCEAETTRYAYGGSFGIGLMSALPLTSVEQTVFDSTTNRRGALHAVVDAPGGDLDVYCTHLTAVFAVIPYPKETGSWAEEQAAEDHALLDWIDTTRGDGAAVVMGDFNAGPEIGPGVLAVQPDNWAIVEAAGFEEPYVDQVGECSMCPDNPFRADDSDPILIDHLLFDGMDGEFTASRVLEDPIDVTSCGEAMTGAYSDHYGVQVTVRR